MNRPGRASESRPQATTSSRSSRAAPRPFFGAPDKKLFNLFNYLIFELFLFAGNNVITLVGRSASDLSQARLTPPPPPPPYPTTPLSTHAHPRREGKRDERREGVTEGGEGARERGERGERRRGGRGAVEGMRLRTCVSTSLRDRRPGRRQMEERPDEVIYVERVLHVYGLRAHVESST